VNIVHEPRVEGDVLHTFADGSRAEEQIGFRARVDLAAGLEQEVAWVVSEGSAH
jgi:UDP-glucose 4-epimerase